MVPVRRQEQSESVPPGQEANEYATHLTFQEYGLVARLLLTPFWWAFTSIPAWRAIWQFIMLLISGKPKWEKTPHGHDMSQEDNLEKGSDPKQLTTTTAPISAAGLPTTHKGEPEKA